MELAVGGVGQDADRGLLVLHQHRDCRSDHVGRVWADQQVDFVDIDQLGVDPRHVRRIALVVIEHKLDRAPEQPALGVDVVTPNLQRRQHLLAGRRHAAGQCHAEADPDRLRGIADIGECQRACDRQRRNGASAPNDAQDAHVLLPVPAALPQLGRGSLQHRKWDALLDERISNRQLINTLPVLQVLGIEHRATCMLSGSDDEAVVDREVLPACDVDRHFMQFAG